MNRKVVTAIFTLSALLAVHAQADDTVKIWTEGGIAVFDAGKHQFAGTIIAVNVPPSMGIVCYRKSKLVGAYSSANSGVKTQVEVDSIQVVDRFPSSAEIEKLLSDSDWVGEWNHSDGTKFKSDLITFKNGELQSDGVTYNLQGLRHVGDDVDSPVSTGIPNDGRGHEVEFEWITPTVLKGSGWNIGQKSDGTRINPGKYQGLFRLFGADDESTTDATDNTDVIAIDIKSDDDGNILQGNLTYSNESPLAFFGHLREKNSGDNFDVENKLGNDWKPAGRWVIGGRDDRQVVAFNVKSSDNGESLNGTMAYSSEGEIRVRAKRGNGVVYDVDSPHDGHRHEDGAWILGARGDKKQYLVAIDIDSNDDGQTFSGIVVYEGEGPIDFRATRMASNSYRAEVSFGDEWHPAGDWIIGGRDQRAVKVSAKSTDGGKSLNGTVTYQGEGPINMEATLSGSSAYTVENQWGNPDSDWNPGGVFVLGNRERSESVSNQSGFPEGYFYLTTKSGENEKLVLESAPLTLKPIGNYTGMWWKATPIENADGYFYLTSQYLAEKNQVLESSDGNNSAVMVPNEKYSGTMWKVVAAGDGYFYLTSKPTESQNKVLDGNVGHDAGANAIFLGAPFMVEKNSAGPGALWKFVPVPSE